MSEDEASKLVGIALAAFPSMQDKAMKPTVKTWALVLADIDYHTAEAGLMKVLSEKSFFPTPADIIKALKSMKELTGKGAPSAEIAWREITSQLNSYQKPKYSHQAIEDTVSALGYLNLCHSENIVADRAHFFKIYETVVERQKNEIDSRRILNMIEKRKNPNNQQPSLIGNIIKQIADKNKEVK